MKVPFNDLQRGVTAIQGQLEAAALNVLRSGWFVLGQSVQTFEAAFARYCGAQHCIGVANGSDALELALRALGVSAGTQVACVANAGFYAPTAIYAVGATPLFVDVNSTDLLMDHHAAQQALAQTPAALILTHLYGRLADVRIIAAARDRGIPVIEDCAQAHGARRGEHSAGSLADIGCFSFYPTKNLGALGDGGACVTSDPALAARLRALRQYGWSEKYRVSVQGGRNSRLDELQAALLQVRLSGLDQANRARQRIALRYTTGIRHRQIQLPAPPQESDVVHLYVLRSTARDALRDWLRQHEIGCDVHYPIADHQQPAYAADTPEWVLPQTDQACKDVLSLPCFPELTDAEIEAVVQAVNAWPGQS
jgi:dTDP-4-amino-4,6-dideoxygalactose transaminase